MDKIVMLLFIVFVLFSSINAQNNPFLLDSKIRDIFLDNLSGELAKNHVYKISRYHRVQGSRGYRASAKYVLEQLRNYGFNEEDAYIESFKSDGRIVYQTWQSPSGWDMEKAGLNMLEPYNEKIVRFPEVAMSLITYSNPGDVTAELVWVGEGISEADYSEKTVSGKFVLATGYGGSVHRLAVLKYGAKAVICYLDDDRAKEHPDMLAYTGMWPKTEELDRVTFGFNISKRQGDKLRTLVESGQKVVMNGWAKGIGLEPYFMDVVVAHIRGSLDPEEEIVFCAHLDHPKESANDNASGSAALLDIAGTIKELTGSRQLPTPKRSLRLLWVPEFYGSMAYIDSHEKLVGPDKGGKILGNLNLDMVGENLEMIHTKMILTRTPDSNPSVLNDVVENMAELVDNINIRTARGSQSVFNYRITPYSGGSDHMVFIDRKIPGIMIGHSPDYTHHTSDDTPDRVDPVELKRTEMIAVSTYWYLANLDQQQALELAYMTGANSAKRLGQVPQKIMRNMSKAGNSNNSSLKFEIENKFEHLLQREIKTLNSILYFCSSSKIRTLIKRLNNQLKQQKQLLLEGVQNELSELNFPEKNSLSEAEKPDNRIPVRITRGPLSSGLPESKLPEDRKELYSSDDFIINGNIRFELLNFLDGKLTVSEIRNALSAEFVPVKTKIVARFIEDLVYTGLAEWK